MNKKIYKSTNDKLLAGVLGGVSKYLNWNSTIVRIAFVILALIPGLRFAMILIYILGIIIIPSEKKKQAFSFNSGNDYNRSNKSSRKNITNVEERDVDERK